MSDIIDIGTKHPEQERPLRIAICIPTHGTVPADFAFSLAGLLVYTTQTLVLNGMANFGLLIRKDTYVHTGREQLAVEAVNEGFDYILWLDSDMTFPQDLLIRLLMHEVPIVGVNYSTRSKPVQPVAIKRLNVEHPGDGAALYTTPESTGLEEVEAVGFGAVLMKTSVLRNLERPWFFHKMIGEQHLGEDVWFCQLAREAGWKVMVDHDTSKLVGHVGLYNYDTIVASKMDMQVRAMAEAGEEPTLDSTPELVH